MADKTPSSATLLPVGILLIPVGIAIGRSDAMVFGLSANFWSGFVLALAVGTLFLSIILGQRKPRA